METPKSTPVDAVGASRRDFMKTAGTAAAAVVVAPQRAVSAEEQKLPLVRWGKNSISRLVCGSNPFGGLSHLSGMINREMRQYFTPDQELKTCRRCTEVGINTFEPLSANTYKQLAAQGIKIQGFLRGQGDPARIPTMAQAGGVIGIHHYDVATDNWFKQGQLEVVREYTKRVRDTGLLVGVASHIPECIAEVDSQGWMSIIT